MYEHITYEGIMSRILARVPDTLDKREGSIIYDAVAPIAVEIQNFKPGLYRHGRGGVFRDALRRAGHFPDGSDARGYAGGVQSGYSHWQSI